MESLHVRTCGKIAEVSQDLWFWGTASTEVISYIFHFFFKNTPKKVMRTEWYSSQKNASVRLLSFIYVKLKLQ